MPLKGFLIGGLIACGLAIAGAVSFVWLNVEVFDEVGYKKGLAIDGAQMAGIIGGCAWYARRQRRKD